MRYVLVVLLACAVLAQISFIYFMHDGEVQTPPPLVRQIAMGEQLNRDLGDETIRGTVRDEQGAVAGAMITVTQRPLDPTALIDERPGRVEWQTSSGRDGTFTLDTLPEGFFLVRAQDAKRQAVANASIDSPGIATAISLQLQTAVAFHGTVRGVKDAPLKNAIVIPVPEGAGGDMYRYAARYSNADGAFTFDQLPTGTWRFLVAAKDYAPVLTAPAQPGVSLVVNLGAGETLTGRVVESGGDKPVSGVKVVLREMALGLETASGKSDNLGQFQAARLRPGTYRVELASNKVALMTDVPEITVGAGALEPLTLAVVPAASVRGRVVHAEHENQGVPEAVVVVTNAEGAAPVTATTDTGGYYRVTGLRPGAYNIALAGSAPVLPVEVISGATINGPTFTMRPGEMLHGRALTQDGQPVAEAIIVAVRPGADQPARLRTDDEGNFSLPGVQPNESIRIWAEKDNLRSEAVEAVMGTPVELRLAQRPQGAIKGFVTQGKGVPLPGAHISCLRIDAQGHDPLLARADASGMFQFTGLEAGRYRVVAARQQAGLKDSTFGASVPVTDARQGAPLEIDLPPVE